MNINYFIKIIFRRIWLLITVPLLALIAVLYFTKDYKKEYLSTAQLTTGFTVSDQVKVNDNKTNSIQESEVKFNNVIQNITSLKVASLMAYSLMMHDLISTVPYRKPSEKNLNSKIYLRVTSHKTFYERILKGHLDSLQVLNSYNSDERLLLEFLRLYSYDYEALVKDQIFAARVENTDYIYVGARTENPELSAAMVNTLCYGFLKFNNLQRIERFDESINTFKSLANQKKLEFDKKTDLLKSFKSSQGILNIDNESKSKNDLMKDYEASLSDAQNNLYSAKVELVSVNKRLQALGGSTGPQVNISNINQRILKLRDDITSLRNKAKESPADDKYKKQLATLRNQLSDLESNDNSADEHADAAVVITTTKSVKEDLEDRKSTLLVKIESLQQSITEYEGKLNVLKITYGTYASKEATLASLQKDVDLAQQEFSTAQERYNQALDVSSASGSEKIRQTLFGQPAVRAEPSKKLLIVSLALVTSFLLCVLSIIIIEFLDNSLKTAFIFQQYVGLTLIGTANRLPIQFNLDELLLTTGTKNKKFIEFRDLLKKTRYSLEKALDKIFLLTSTKKGEGKSTLIIALAMILAGSRKKVLVIDTNFSNNSLTRHFSATPTLENLGQRIDLQQEEFDAAISRTNIPNLDIIGCESGIYSPSEIFPKDSFLNKLNSLTTLYDYVFLEGAALNKYSDSKELAVFASSVIAVFSASSVISHSDEDSIDFLRSLDEKFTGAILNKVLLENTNL